MTGTRLHFLFFSLILALLFGESRLQSGDAASGDDTEPDDADDTDSTRQKSRLTVGNITRNSSTSDFSIYANLARDDHEMVLNLKRLRNKAKMSRNRTRQDCLIKCQRHHLVCLHQLGSSVKKGQKPCAVCLTQCDGSR